MNRLRLLTHGSGSAAPLSTPTESTETRTSFEASLQSQICRKKEKQLLSEIIKNITHVKFQDREGEGGEGKGK